MPLVLMNPPDPTPYSLQADAEIIAARNHTLTKHTCTNMTSVVHSYKMGHKDETQHKIKYHREFKVTEQWKKITSTKSVLYSKVINTAQLTLDSPVL